MRRLALCALLLAGCSAPDDSSFAFKCLPGLPESYNEQAMLDLAKSWGTELQFRSGVSLASATLIGNTVYVSPELCQEHVEVCVFALWHEIGHKNGAVTEDEADCFAAEHATKAEVDATICSFAYRSGETPDGLHRVGVDRAEWIRGCR